MPASPELPPSLRQERLGDWSGFTGSHYHLVFALHALLTGAAEEVILYGGNDLLVRSAGPPPLLGEGESCQVALTRGDRDVWIQLKSSDDVWTPRRLLGDNILSNFLRNV